MKEIAKLEYESKPLSECLVLWLDGDYEAHAATEGTLVDVRDDDKPLHVAWLWSDRLQSVIAAVFNPQQWTKAQAEQWLQEAIETAKAQTIKGLTMTNGKQPIIGSVQKPHAARRFVGGAREHEVRALLRELGVAAVRSNLIEHGESIDQFSPGFQRDFLAAELKEYAYAAAGYTDPADVAALVNRVKGNGQASSKRQAVASSDVQSLVNRVRGRKAAQRDVQQLVAAIKPDATSKE